MSKGTFVAILIIIVCTLIAIGVSTLPLYSGIKAEYYNLSGTPTYDFSATLQDASNLFTKIGDFGRDVLEKIGLIKSSNIRLYIKTYTDGNGNYAYLVYYDTTYLVKTDPITNIPIFETHYCRIYAYQDYENSNTFNQYIKTLGCKYYMSSDTFANNSKWNSLVLKKQLETQATNEYYYGAGSGTTYTYETVSIDIFNMNQSETYNFIYVS